MKPDALLRTASERTGEVRQQKYLQMVNVMEDLIRFTIHTRENKDYLLDRYSERKASVAALSERVNQKSI